MRKLFFALSILIISSSSYAAPPDNLKYDFKQGDEFVVMVRNYGRHFQEEGYNHYYWNDLNPFSLDFYFLFKPHGKRGDLFELNVEIKRFTRWRFNRCYDSKYNNSPLFKSEYTLTQMLDKPFKIWVDKDGTVSNLEGIEEIYQGIINELHSKNFNEFYVNYNPIAFASQPFKVIIQQAFPPLKDHIDIKKIDNKKIKLSYQPKIIPFRTNETLRVYRDGQLFRRDSNVIDTIFFSKDKGRFIQGALFNEDKYLLGETKPIYTISKTKGLSLSVLKAGVSETHFVDLNSIKKVPKVSIKGKIAPNNLRQISVYVQKRYADSECFKKVSAQIKEDGSFDLAFALHRPMELTIRLGEIGNENSFAENLFIEPGDSINVSINSADKKWTFKGSSAAKFAFAEMLKGESRKIGKLNITSDEDYISNINITTDHLLGKLKNQTFSISAKNYFKAEIFFGTAMTAPISWTTERVRVRTGTTNANKKIYKERFTDNKLLQHCNYVSNQMRGEIRSYLLHQKEVLGIHRSNHSDEKVFFDLSKLSLKDEMRYYSMSQNLHTAIQKGQIEDAKDMLSDLSKEFPYSEMSKIFANKLGNNASIQQGKEAPDFSLRNDNSRLVSLSDFKGKWVYLLFAETEDEYDLHQLKLMQAMRDSVQAENFETVVVATNKEWDKTKLRSIREIYSGPLLINENWQNTATQNYKATIAKSAFLINPNGNFDVIWDGKTMRGNTKYSLESMGQYATKLDIYIKNKAKSFEAKSDLSNFFWWLGGFALAGFILWLYFNYRNKKLKKEEAQKREKVQLELRAIRSQLNPHFMFNTLNSIQHLVSDERNEEASQYIAEFSGLMRQVLNNSEHLLIPLNDEIKSIDTYLRLEALRFNFQYTIECDPLLDINNIEIPGLLIQPFVENAVIHGIPALGKQGNITVKFKKDKHCLKCSIEDNGKGFSLDENSLKLGKGISLSKKRLEVLRDTYKMEIDLNISNKQTLEPAENGTLVELLYELEHE
ncbi:histidine kinase [Carboxylicivirga sp. N1Y90]|uniref:histidine kinase n=1 Tax=Carboxylicivirga fragile TaxID=3417571 RepID=UPI003D35558C|nr:histidine kinase [Marinilabiliaceae bacterium N1Y90]